MKRISINICSKDRPSELAICVSSLLASSFKDWDLVVLDDGGGTPVQKYKFIDDVFKRVVYEDHGFQLIRNKFSLLNIGKARNQLIREDEFQNPLILRVDDDSWVHPDYLQMLYDELIKDDKCGGIGGTVPLMSGPNHYRNVKVLGGVFNEIKYDKKGNITYLGDDGGLDYNVNSIMPSHHLRSSWLFRRDASSTVGHFPLDYGVTGFREETHWSIAMRYAGYSLKTVTQAMAFHMPCLSGGARIQNYPQVVRMNDEHFRRWAKWQFEKNGGEPGV